jgi:ribosome-binding factor A
VPKEFPRSRRVEEQIQRVLGDAIRARARDPRLRGVILTDVRVSRDLSVARVYYSVLHPTSRVTDPQPGLDAATGFLRSVLARELQVRHVPELRFLPDEVARRGAELDRLIDEAVGRARPGDTLPDGSDKDPS